MITDIIQWLTTHEPSTEYDIGAALRENFDPRRRWRLAIASARALARFGKVSSPRSRASSVSSAGSGGWGEDHLTDGHNPNDTTDTSRELDTMEAAESLKKLSLGSGDPGSNDYVKVTSFDENQPDDESKVDDLFPSDYLIEAEKTGVKQNSTNSSTGSVKDPPADRSKMPQAKLAASLAPSNPSITVFESTRQMGRPSQEEPRIPGSFYVADVGWERSILQHGTGNPTWWQGLFKKLGL